MNYERLKKVYKAYGMKILPVKVWQMLELWEEIKIWENKKIWKFKCLVIKTWKKWHPDGTFTVRGKFWWLVIEKIYPFSFNKFKKIILLDEYKHRRSKLYYIREKVWKAARMKSVLKPGRRWIDLLTLNK